MADSNLLYESWKNERILFDKHLDKLKKRVTVKSVHDIRVCVKKLKAYRRLFYEIHKETYSKVKLTETKNFYDTIGRLRNIHICIDLVSACEKEHEVKLKEFRGFLSQRKKQAADWAKHALEKYENDDLKSFELLLEGDVFIKDMRMETSLRNEANKGLSSLVNLTEQPHSVRILLKRIYYWLKILPDADQDYNMEEINNVLEKLGEWQDYEILLVELKFFRKQVIPAPFKEGEDLIRLEKNSSEKKTYLRSSALGKIDRIIKNS